ncbi:hypothetical protein AN640_01820 [Candidatus Epulonipiscium fishelsonii]|uniref:Uncharacterized protein n=1 Tax=Candidatus Epulonipiscium fishelsonii TaxID=77094 RepID=A0ACC8XA70_9FIRM|nr:hypothetical protein AN640_01820 [Epulopiscium sp. SCG-D08WGA-EpuloA1]OON96086.1 MAG: hypothetical protein ATN32_06685 [Epulopiscium sp. AS2M-Bin002]
MLNSINEINESTKTISVVLSIIQNIATQTNLLAFNAGIEAARAGREFESGFSVVANEIRELAIRSGITVKGIEEIIANNIRNVERGQEMAKSTVAILNEIIITIDQNAENANNLLITSESQKEGLEELLLDTEKISEVIETNSVTSEESAAVSEQLAAQAEHLSTLMEYFKTK